MLYQLSHIRISSARYPSQRDTTLYAGGGIRKIVLGRSCSHPQIELSGSAFYSGWVNADPPRTRPKGWLSRHHRQGPRPWRKLRLGFLRWRRTVLANTHTARIYRSIVGGL